MHVFDLQAWVGVDWVGLAWTGLAAIVDWDGLEKGSTARVLISDRLALDLVFDRLGLE